MEEKKGIDTYLDEIGREQLLSSDEEVRLSEDVKAGSERALNKLVEANLRYVVKLASEYRGRGVALDDLISEGNLGLMKAAGKYDGQRGKRFVAFAAPYIRQQMERAIDEQTAVFKVPRDAVSPKADRRSARPLSVDAPLGGRKDMSLLSVIANGDAALADELTGADAAQHAVDVALRRMGGREERVLRAFYGIGQERHTMAEIAVDMGLKRERIRQIRDVAVRKLRKAVKGLR